MILKRNITGFTLIELAVVLFILGLLLSSFLAPLATKIEQEERNNTQIQLDEIKQVLIGYMILNTALPCPDCSDDTTNDCNLVAAGDIDDGEEDVLAGTCATEMGNLPWITLGVKETDEWNTTFTYRVDDSFADTTDGTGCATSATLNVSFSLCSNGEISVSDGTSTIASGIPAIVVSHGSNFDINTAPASADELENTDNNTVFVDRDYSQETGSEFDDMLIWISPHVLRTTAIKAGILP